MYHLSAKWAFSLISIPGSISKLLSVCAEDGYGLVLLPMLLLVNLKGC